MESARQRIIWLAVLAAGLSLVLAATALAAPERAAAFLGRPQRGIAAALAQEARQVVERGHLPAVPGQGHNHSQEWHNAFAEVAVALTLTGQPDAARQLIEDAGEHGKQLIPLSAQVAAALVLAGRVPEAKQIIAESRKEVAAEHLIEIAGWLVADGRAADAERLSRALLTGRVLDKSLADITRALAEQGQIASARRVAVTIKDAGQKTVAFAALASAAAAQRQSRDAELFIAEALEQARLAGDPTVTHVALAPALASLRGAGEVIDLAGRIPDPELRHEALAAAFNTFLRRGKTADAQAIERHAREPIQKVVSDERSSWCEFMPDPAAYDHALAGRVTEAIQAAAAISSPWVRAQTFSCLSILFAETGRPADSRLLLRHALSEAEEIIPDESSSSEGPGCEDSGPISYDFLVEAIVKARDIDEVRRIAETFPNGSRRGFLRALAATALWRAGRTYEAEQLADAAWKAYRDGPAWSDMADEMILWMLAENGLVRQAGGFARSADRMDLASTFAYYLRRLGRFGEAHDLEHHAGMHEKPKSSQPEPYALIRAGRLKEAVARARRVEDSPVKAQVLARAAIRYMRGVPIHPAD